MKKFTSIAAALCLATAFSGFCAGCAANISDGKDAEPKSAVTATADSGVSVAAAGDSKIILCPGWNYEGGNKKLNTLDNAAGVTAMTPAQATDEMLKYWVENAYFFEAAAGATLPTPTAGRSDIEFVGWRQAVDGVPTIVTEMPASVGSNTVILYAEWKVKGTGSNPGDETGDPTVKRDGIYVDGVFAGMLTLNSQADRTEYWLGGSKVNIAEGKQISIYMDGQPVEFYVEPSSAGIEKPESSQQVTSVTVTVGGDFAIYLHKNSSDWSCEFAGPTQIDTTSEIPQGCAGAHLTFGSNDITFYLLTSNGSPVGEADLSKYCLYTFGEELFGKWAESTTKGLLKSEMTATGNITADGGWIFRWGSGFNMQTANITGLDTNGAKYIITLPAENNGTAGVKKVVA